MVPELFLRAALSTFVALALAGCGVPKEKMDRVEAENHRLYGEKQKLEDELRKLRLEIAVEKKNRESLESQLGEARQRNEAMRKELDTARKAHEDYRREFHLQSRVRAVGEKHERIALVSGRVYEEVEIRAVLRDSIVFTHRDGQARLPLANLGEKWTRRFDVGANEPVCLVDEETLKEACAAVIRQ